MWSWLANLLQGAASGASTAGSAVASGAQTAASSLGGVLSGLGEVGKSALGQAANNATGGAAGFVSDLFSGNTAPVAAEKSGSTLINGILKIFSGNKGAKRAGIEGSPFGESLNSLVQGGPAGVHQTQGVLDDNTPGYAESDPNTKPEEQGFDWAALLNKAGKFAMTQQRKPTNRLQTSNLAEPEWMRGNNPFTSPTMFSRR